MQQLNGFEKNVVAISLMLNHNLTGLCNKIQPVGKKYRDKTTLASKTRFSRHCFGSQSWHFSLLVSQPAWQALEREGN